MTIAVEELRALSEQAISQGEQLLHQSQALLRDAPSVPLRVDPRPEFQQEQARGIFGQVEIDGQHRSAMACHQSLRLEPQLGPTTAQALREFAFRQLMREGESVHEGRKVGFTVRRLLPAELQDHDSDARLALDWRSLDDNVPWATISIELHDFELRMGRLSLRPRQMVYVVQSPAFMADESRPSTDIVHRVSVGYPFVQYAPLRNPFGFGPGKFGAAIKLFTFSLRADRSLEIDMFFIAAPRCEKVLDIWGLPDPVYGSFRLLERISLGAWHAQPSRDRLEALMLETHCRAHAAFLAGFARRWKKTK